jgi:helicase
MNALAIWPKSRDTKLEIAGTSVPVGVPSKPAKKFEFEKASELRDQVEELQTKELLVSGVEIKLLCWLKFKLKLVPMPERTLSSLIQDSVIIERLGALGITQLTDVQVKAIDAGLLQGESLFVSAPTSSGKTLIAEMAAIAAIESGLRVLYLVSHRALADQKFLDFEQRLGSTATKPMTTVAISTGDRTEGQADAQIRVATYEKAIGLLMAGQLQPDNTLVVADELQILCDPKRGPDIESLCAILRERNVKQFIALTATVDNPGELADWMHCKLVQSDVRGTPLEQEIWYGASALVNTYGEDALRDQAAPVTTRNVPSIVTYLLDNNLGPVLVFSETKREVTDLAADFMRTRQKTTHGIAMSDQLELFSEPTEFSEKLRNSTERCVAFHTADLSSQERLVLEDGFSNSRFDVCFATSTLAAGVNYPFRTILFPKLTYQYRDPPGSKMGLAEYRNMSGRAGRLGFHTNGKAILLPKDAAEMAHARTLVGSKNERVDSVILKLSLRKTLLSLVASRIASSLVQIEEFFQNTLYWHQVVQKHPNSKMVLQNKTREAMDWLIDNKLVEDNLGEYLTTQLGRASAMSGLLPETTVQFAKALDSNRTIIEQDFESVAAGLIYTCCASPEFSTATSTRFLPYVQNDAFGALDFWKARVIPVHFDRAAQQVQQAAQAVVLYTTGLAERKIAYTTGVPSGAIQRLSFEVAWILEGMQRIAVTPDLQISQVATNQLSQLSRRVRWGVPAANLDLLRLAEKHRVPGVGRQRTMELVQHGFNCLQDLVSAGREKLLQVLKHSVRVEALLSGAASSANHEPVPLQDTHSRVAAGLGIEEIVDRCYKELGVEYEKAILELLSRLEHIESKVIDAGTRKNYPDLHLKYGDLEVLLECKTTSKHHGLLAKEEAWAVIQKSSDFAPHASRATLGKPRFDETCKQKISATRDLTLVENEQFIEAALRVLLKEIDSSMFMKWLMEPGLAELDRLPGRYTYQLR